MGFLVGSLTFASSTAFGITAVPVKLAWNPSPDTSVTGYAVYYGLEGSSVTNRIDTGMAEVATVEDLDAGVSYFFYVVAYDASGNESMPSNVLMYSPPALSKLRLTRQATGSVSLSFHSAAGAICRIEYTSSLFGGAWQIMGYTTADANGNVTYVDTAPVDTRAARFYRAVRF